MGLLATAAQGKFDSELKIVPAHPDHLKVFWPIILPWLEEALKHSPVLFLPEDIRQRVADKDFICWLALVGTEIIGFSITSIVQYPQAKVCDIHWTGGAKHRGRQWLAGMLEVLKGWAKSNECSMLGGGGREGWIDVFGFKKSGVLFIMEI